MENLLTQIEQGEGLTTEFKTSFQKEVIYGSGIARIKNECKTHGISEPVFEKFQHGFKVTLYKQKKDEGISFLYVYIKQNPSKRVSQIQTQLKTPAKTIERWIKQLRDEGKIEYRGSKKTGGYYVK